MKRQLLKWPLLGGLLLLIILTGLGSFKLVETQAQEPVNGTPEAPLLLGAWLYEGHCVRCHGPYEQDRVGAGVGAEDLIENIKNGGCAVSWSRRTGGELTNTEIEAVARYILAWEEEGGQPDLPELPPQPTVTPCPPTPLPAESESTFPSPPATVTPISPVDKSIQQIISGNPLAWGAWLYTQNCHRCHQAYEDTRQGRGISAEQLEDTIENGKTATNMKPFGRKKGGTLKSKEIEAIVLYIRTWEKLGTAPALPTNLFTPPTPDPAILEPVALPSIPAIQGNAEKGAMLYKVHCQQCHAAEGWGLIGPSLVKPWMSSRPDLIIFSTITQGVPNSAMPAWDQANGGPLKSGESNDLTVFILKWATSAETSPPVVTSPSIRQGLPGLLALALGPAILVLLVFITGTFGQRQDK